MWPGKPGWWRTAGVGVEVDGNGDSRVTLVRSQQGVLLLLQVDWEATGAVCVCVDEGYDPT